jgi:hypothetical protein
MNTLEDLAIFYGHFSFLFKGLELQVFVFWTSNVIGLVCNLVIYYFEVVFDNIC